MAVRQLEIGQDSAEVHALMGAPEGTQKGESGKTLEIYRTSAHRVKGVPSRTFESQSVDVLYDAAGLVEKWAHYTNRIQTRIDEAFRAGTYISDSEQERIVKDATTAADLIEYFGEPTSRGLTVYGIDFLKWEYIEEGRGWRKTRSFSVLVNADSIVTAFSSRDFKD